MDTSKADVKAMITVLNRIAEQLDGLGDRVNKDPDWADQWTLITPDDGGRPYHIASPEVTQLLHRMEWAASMLREAADMLNSPHGAGGTVR